MWQLISPSSNLVVHHYTTLAALPSSNLVVHPSNYVQTDTTCQVHVYYVETVAGSESESASTQIPVDVLV